MVEIKEPEKEAVEKEEPTEEEMKKE